MRGVDEHDAKTIDEKPEGETSDEHSRSTQQNFWMALAADGEMHAY